MTPSSDARPPTPGNAEAARVMARIDAMAPLIARHAPSFDQLRRLPPDIISALKSARIYSMLVPRRYGGLELDPISAFRAVASLARLDGSVGWNAMIGHIGGLMPFLAHPTLCEQIYQDGQDHIIAGSGQPVGTAERVAGGLRVSGVWPFASGCQNAEWIGGVCIMTEDGAPIAAPDTPGPMMRLCLLPADRWDIRDTWHTVGLAGTGSHHVALTDAFVPDTQCFDFPFGVSFAPDPVFAIYPELVVLSHGAVAVGMAEGAISDLLDLARSGVKQLMMTTKLVETDRFKEGLARLGADLMAAQALLEAQVNRLWQNPQQPTVKGLARMAEPQQAAAWITSACLRVVEGCFELAGSSGVYESSPLQRRLRDLRVAAQHAAVHPRHYATAGAAMLERLS